MPTINIESVASEGNVRTDVGDTSRLEESIDRIGLLQPIVVAPRGDGYVVIDGHRRLQACRNIGETDIDVVLYTYMEDDSDRVVAQFVANEERVNLTAYERAQATLALKDQGLTQTQIATELNLPKGEVSKLQKVARAIPSDVAEQANRFTEKGLFDIADETGEDPEIAGMVVTAMVEDNASLFSAKHRATSYVLTQRFLTEHEPLFETLASLGVDIADDAPRYDSAWFPIAATPQYEGTILRGQKFVDTDLAAHRTEPCHYAWLESEYSGAMFLVEACVEPLRHADSGSSSLKIDQATEKAKATNSEKERKKQERKAKQERKEKAVVWLGEQKATTTAAAEYVDEAWRTFLTNDMAQQFNKVMDLEKIYVHGGYSATATMEKYIEERFSTPAARMMYLAYLLHAYQYVLAYHQRKELGL